MTTEQSNVGETLVSVVNEHWIKYVFPVVMYVLLLGISLLLFILAGITAHHYMWLSHVTFVAGLLLFLLTHHWFFMVLLSESLDRIIITNRRLIRLQYRLILHEDVLEVSFEKMKTVNAQKEGFLQNVLNYGSLLFENNKAIVSSCRIRIGWPSASSRRWRRNERILSLQRRQITDYIQWMDDVLRLFSCHPLLNALDGSEVHASHAVIRVERDVWGCDDFRMFDECLVLLEVLLMLQNVEKGVGDLATLESLQERLRIDERSASRIHQHDTIFHP